jgi:hypothetical protein
VSSTVPVPELAFVMQARGQATPPHPLAPLLSDTHVRPYDWMGHEGGARSWLGERLTLCLAGDESNWLATSTARSMAEMAGRMTRGAGVRADVALHADWSRVGALADQAIRTAAENELIPGMDSRDAGFLLGPVAHAIGQLGRLQVAGEMRGGRLVFRGNLALGAAESAP